MSLRAGVGVARGSDGFEAGRNAALAALRNAESDQATAALVFASVRYAPDEVQAGVKAALPRAVVAGCSEAGVITQRGIVTGAVAVMTLHKEGLTASGALLDDLDHQSLTPGSSGGDDLAAFAQQAAGDESRLHLLLLDGLAARGASVLAAVQDALAPTRAPLAGGCAGDGLRFTGTFQIGSHATTRNGAVLLSLGGDLVAGIGVRHGFSPTGPPQPVTAANNNVLSEIAGRPAVDFYASYFGTAAHEIGQEPMARLCAEYPLGVESEEGFLLARDVLHLRPGGELQLAGNIEKGHSVRLITGSKQDLLRAAEQAAGDALNALGAPPRAALIFNCAGRYKVFGSQAHQEIECIAGVIGQNVPLLGFYTYGELAPVVKNGACRLHNKTVVVVLLA